MIIVIGTGIIGLFSAYELIKRGLNVTLLDFDSKATASNASVGMLAPAIESKPMENKLLELMINSKKIWADIQKKNNISKMLELKNNSSLLISMNNDDHERIIFKKKFFEQLNFESKILSPDETLKLEPSLNSNIYSSLFCKDQNQVNPRLLMKFLIDEITKKKGKIIKTKFIKKISFSNGLLCIEKQKFKAEKVIICCGAWSGKLIQNSFGIELPLRPLKGISMLLKSKNIHFNNNLWFRNIYIAQRANNILAVGATEEEKGFESTVNLDEVYFLAKSLWECFPNVENIEFKKFTAGLRPSMIDGYPVIGPIDSISKNILCNFGHYRHGILLSPISSKILADYVCNNDVEKKYKFFSPERFNL
jgi:glycine oxidase